MPEIAEKDLHLLFELGSLGRLKRNYALHPEAPSVAAHSHRVAFIALMLAKLEQADMHKTLYMALTHDIPETRTGDLTLFQEPYVQKDELKAVGDMFSESIFSEIIDIFKEYEDRETLEAQVVKDADVIAAEMEMMELEELGFRYPSYWAEERKGMKDRLRTESGKKLHALIKETCPYAWMKRNPNSYHQGTYGK